MSREKLGAALDVERKRRRWRHAGRLGPYAEDPIGFVRDVLGEHLWSRQRDIAEAVRDRRRVAVPSCHDAGKSFLAARIAAWWIATRPPGEAFVVTSAPTFAQVRAILWREINRAHGKGRLPGRVNQTEWFLGRELVGFGRKPSDADMTAFQGIHAERVLVIFDEACGIEKPLWDAAETLVTNAASRLFAIGNPDDPTSAFAAACAPGSGWHVLPIDALETPNFTGEPIPAVLSSLLISPIWVDEKRIAWGENSSLWTAKVRGRFPELSDDGVLSPAAIREAIARTLAPDEPSELGVDVARHGSDETIILHRAGSVARIHAAYRGHDLMETVGRVVQATRQTNATAIKVDDAGLGGGVVDRLKELGLPVVAVNGGSRPREPERFLNRRAELYWGLRQRAESGDLDLPDDDILARQLVAVRYRLTSRGQIQIESKDDAKRRGHPSPDRADALTLAFADAGLPEPELAAPIVVAGSRQQRGWHR